MTTTTANAVLLKTNFWLQHVVDTSGADREVSFAEYWAVETLRPWPAYCCLCAMKPPTLGAHVMSMHSGVGVVIVPACGECNSNPTKLVKYGEIKFDVWAARVSKSELQRIERQQRLSARHQRAEAKRELIRSLPAVGVPVPVSIPPRRRAPSERGRQHRHDCRRHFDATCPCGRRSNGSETEARADDDSKVQERLPTPRPPSPETDPEVIDLRPVGSAAAQRQAPIGPASGRVAVSDDDDRVTGILADMLCGNRPATPQQPPPPLVATPRPQRRRAGGAAAAAVGDVRKLPSVRRQADAMQTIGRCKQIVGQDGGGGDDDDDDDDDDLRFCNQATCSKRPECPGSSKAYCCLHCKCKHCVKPPPPPPPPPPAAANPSRSPAKSK